MPAPEIPVEDLPEAFLRRKAQLLQEQELRVQAERELDTRHVQILDSLMQALESFRTRGPRDVAGNPLWVGVQQIEKRHTVIYGFFSDRFPPETWLLIFTVTLVDDLISLTDRVHTVPADVEDVDSLLDVVFQRIADYTADFLPYPPELDKPLDAPNRADDGVTEAESESFSVPMVPNATDESNGNGPTLDQTADSPVPKDEEEGFTLAIVKVRLLREESAMVLEEQLQDFFDHRNWIPAFSILPAEESFFDVDPLDPKVPRWYFRILLALEGERSADQLESDLMAGVTSELLPFEEVVVQELAHRDDPVFFMTEIVEGVAQRLRSGL
jgi:hypothetical protein